ncbi:signal peptidase I [Salisediminibacterium selenitireducens]|uniref:Signal peptidase I n=1 Tax=Bacillus selenitireducens (strain ATCC 700615 / DSM 15326 / MLS10) TaxID=439292 RepID=D6XXL5_BACIE|nr:signal peptidase I [Salisediminibacterium selenitireducens]ADI00058.1 signal peptidase I [[Bacillus] selenitireducens MLS10]
MDTEPGRRTSWKSNLLLFTKVMTVAFVLFVLVRGFMFTNYIVYGQSMMPTIEDGERIIVNKIGYEIAEPNRFDLIIFHVDETTDYIKRVIGLPGDHIEYNDDQLYINGETYEEPFLTDYLEASDERPFTTDFILDELLFASEVPEGHVFVLGDNRQNSVDSRHIGFVPMDEIVGQANMAFWPIHNIRLFR